MTATLLELWSFCWRRPRLFNCFVRMMASLQYFEIMDAVIHTKNKHTSKSEKNNARGVWKKMKKIPIMHISQKTMKQFLLKTIMWIPWYNHSIPITTQDYVYESFRNCCQNKLMKTTFSGILQLFFGISSLFLQPLI